MDEMGPELADSPIASKSSTLQRSSRLPLPSLDVGNKSMTSKTPPPRLMPPPRSNATSLLSHHNRDHPDSSSSRLSSPYSPSPTSPLRQSPTHSQGHFSQRGSPSAHYQDGSDPMLEMLGDGSKSQLHLPNSAAASPTRRKAKEGNVRVIVRYSSFLFLHCPFPCDDSTGNYQSETVEPAGKEPVDRLGGGRRCG